MEEDGGWGGRDGWRKKIYLMSKISEYLLYIVLLIIEYNRIRLFSIWSSAYINTIPFHLLGCFFVYFNAINC